MRNNSAGILWRHVSPFLGCMICGILPVFAQVLEPESLLRRQEDQQRARSMTRELLGGVLDIQLRQLDENGLSDQEIYRDITLMRQNLNHLVETEMTRVVELLAEGQRQPADQREATFVEARQQIRTIVRQLSVERHNLLKRLKVAELVEQIRRIIRQQSAVQTATRGLPAERPSQQEVLTLQAIEDQRDVKALFLHLVDSMDDMKSWNGPLSMAATDGLRILKAAEVGRHLDEAGRQLDRVGYQEALLEQERSIKGLQELLKFVERTQGAVDPQLLASLARVRELTEQQKQIREATNALGDQQASTELVERQAKLQKEIGSLTGTIPGHPKADMHILQAEKSALEAASHLLDSQVEPAIVEQGRVLANLAALELAMQNQSGRSVADKSATELAAAIRKLLETKEKLTQIRSQQRSAQSALDHNTPSAPLDLSQIEETTRNIRDDVDLPSSVQLSLSDATQAAAQAMTVLSANDSQAPLPDQTGPLDTLAQKLDRALATIESALSDAERRESAVKIGEYARAAEVLERAAAEERTIAAEALLLTTPGQDAESRFKSAASALAERQQNVQLIAEKTADALREIAPSPANGAGEGAAWAEKSAAILQSMIEKEALPSVESAQSAADGANESAQRLANAAKEIRQLVVTTARELAERTSTQADQIAAARTAVEESIGQSPEKMGLTRLQSARHELHLALQEQARASGKPEAAMALQRMSEIFVAIDAQAAATDAAQSVQAGTSTELKATLKQEEAAEKTQLALNESRRPHADDLSSFDESSRQLQDCLQKAYRASAAAAKQTLDGQRAEAALARRTADSELQNALTMVQRMAVAALAAPAHAPVDIAAQRNAAAATKRAHALASEFSPQAALQVHPAVEAVSQAERATANNDTDLSALQIKAETAIQSAMRQLEQSIKGVSETNSSQLAEQAKQDLHLADQVARVDPSAATSIDAAAEAARAGSRAEDSPQRMSAAMESAESSLAQASASLGAKEQEIRRDQAIAETVAQLATDQQSAADTINQKAAELEQGASSDEETSDTLQSAAQSLNEAQEQFAESQRATGQGAVELSGQTEVANQPLREALELASQLPAKDLPSAESMEAEIPEGQLPPGFQDSSSNSPSDPASTPSDTTMAGTETKASRPSPPGSGPSQASQPKSLGTGFIPNSPQLTAEMMAGAKAQQAARKALGQQMPKLSQRPANQKSDSSTGKADPAEAGDSVPGEHAESAKLTKNEGSAMTNQKVKDGPAQKHPEGTDAAARSSDKPREKETDIANKAFKDAAWFAKLPPELRKSIRAGAGQKAPRAYEERLKNYLQSVD